MLKLSHGEEYTSGTSVPEGHRRLKEGRESLKGDERKGSPSTSRTEEQTKVIQKCLDEESSDITKIERDQYRRYVRNRVRQRNLSISVIILIYKPRGFLAKPFMGPEFQEVSCGIFCTITHRLILRALSPRFCRKEEFPCYDILPTLLI
jgi:hypothetical protein